jgi:acyl carrier protein
LLDEALTVKLLESQGRWNQLSMRPLIPRNVEFPNASNLKGRIRMENTIEILKQFLVDEKMVSSSEAADLNENVSLLETGIIDSLNLMRLVLFIEKRFQIKVSDDDLIPENFETLDSMLKLIGKKTS